MSEKKFQVGAKGVILHDSKVLLLKSKRFTPGEYYWDLPGGRFQENDTDILPCLMREVSEELPGITNIQLQHILTAGRMPKDFSDGTGLFGVFYEITATLPNPIVLTEEHTEYVWLSKQELEDLYNDPNREFPFDDIFYEACIAVFEK